jgi:cyanophycin synthetase
MTRLITAALEAGRPGMTIVPAAGPAEALRSALALTSGPADPVLFLYEKLEPVLALLGSLGATPAQTPSECR